MPTFVDSLLLKGELDIQPWRVDSEGRHHPLPSICVPNLTTLLGRNLVRDLLWWQSTGDGTQPAGLNKFAIGTSTSAYTASSTAMGNESFRDSFTQRTVSDGQMVIKYYLASGSATSNPSLTEAALWGNNASTASGNGTLYAGTVHSAVAKTTAIAITYTWTLTFSTSSTGSTN